MQMRWKISPLGAVRTVGHVPFGYPLPEGLPEGTTVKLLSFDHGYYRVSNSDGREFEIFMMCVNHPEELLLDGQWWPREHPKIQAEMAKPAHLRRVA
jgi:hypothetical protein